MLAAQAGQRLLTHELAHAIQQHSVLQNSCRSSGASVIQRDPEREPPRVRVRPGLATYEPAFMKCFAPTSGKLLWVWASLFGMGETTLPHRQGRASRRKQSVSDVLQVIIGAGLLGGLLRDDAAAWAFSQSRRIASCAARGRRRTHTSPANTWHGLSLAGSGSDFVEDVAALYQQDGGFNRNWRLRSVRP